jgi:hypothetical protein
MTGFAFPANVNCTEPAGPEALKTALTALPSAQRYWASVANAELTGPINMMYISIGFITFFPIHSMAMGD